jgi:hypothetical protein
VRNLRGVLIRLTKPTAGTGSSDCRTLAELFRAHRLKFTSCAFPLLDSKHSFLIIASRSVLPGGISRLPCPSLRTLSRQQYKMKLLLVLLTASAVLAQHGNNMPPCLVLKTLLPILIKFPNVIHSRPVWHLILIRTH